MNKTPIKTTCPYCGIGEKTIRQVIESHHLSNVAAIGHSTKAGTGCGSCLPELKQIQVN